MHPAASIIFFTTTAGAGYGLLFLLGLLLPAGLIPPHPGLGAAAMAVSLVLITLGLLSSSLHLGHPERAWRAFSQWRSSWLSREGVLAVLTYVPAILLGLGWVFLDAVWTWAGLLAALGAAATVYCTAMIYASLKPIRQWHHPLTAPTYLLFAAATGSLWLAAVLQLFSAGAGWPGLLASLVLALAWAVKWAQWRSLDDQGSASTAETATGLGHLGKVRMLDPPHTEENYLQKEMGFRIARKHAAKLRRLALLFGLALPVFLLLVASLFPGWPAALLAILATAAGMTGVAIERWLFFAEATHTVTLYYGAEAA